VDEQVRDKRATSRFVTGPVREFMLIASPAVTMEKAEVDGTMVRHWGLLGGEARWSESLRAAVDSLALFNQRFGPYPYAELDSVAVPLRNAAGVEYPGLIIMGASLYEPDEERPFLLGLVVSHEVAHQWWYGVVGNDVLEHPWQDEALAVFGSLVYQQEYQPNFYTGTLAFYRSEVELLGEETVDTGLGQSLEEFRANPGLYGPVVYEQGGVFFEELRSKLGEEVFFTALQTYYAQQRYRLAAPEDLLLSFELACNCELDEFYAQWGVE
jgi:aminopeptidase N